MNTFPSQASSNLSRYFLYAALTLALYLAYLLLSPFLHTLIIAIVLTILFHPLHLRILSTFKNRFPSLASLCTCIVIVLGVLVPLVLLVVAMAQQGVLLFNGIVAWVKEGGLGDYSHLAVLGKLQLLLEKYLPYVDVDKLDIQGSIVQFSKTMGEVLLRNLTSIIGNVTSLLIQFFLMVFIMFFLFKEGRSMLDRGLHSIPMSADNKDKVLQRIATVSRSTVLGNFITALLQGLVVGVASAIAGYQGFFWGAVSGISSMIPIVGTALVWTPISVYLAIQGRYGMLVFFLIWNILLGSVVDNIVRPKLLGRKGGIPTLLIFLSVMGGLQVFGILGILYGPIIFSICGVLLYIYELENVDVLGEAK
ncbi:MAG: AI-2E family transporter [Deltaproteobacteria bacterium]|nr:AI-2E family transporter [Deltaproteobacteria bacterium]